MSEFDTLAGMIVTTTLDTGGVTVATHGFIPADGYMVGGVVQEEVWNVANFRTNGVEWVEDFISAHADVLDEDEMYVGAWLNPLTNMVHLDISQRFHTYSQATRTGYERNQLAIFDTTNSITVALDDRD